LSQSYDEHVDDDNRDEYKNITKIVTMYIIFEIVFGLIFLSRATIALFFKLKRGWVRTIYDYSNYIFLLRCLNLILLSI
jgi:hypothetical protein